MAIDDVGPPTSGHVVAGPPAPIPASSPAGYELLDEIGRGGMGVVYRADDKRFHRDVAVKLLAEMPAGGDTARFLAEAHITGQLQHPGIPAVHELGTLADGRPFLSMKLVKGSTLQSLLADCPNVHHERGRYLAIFEQVCQAVAYAHTHRVIHRDLKPSNVMVGAFGEVQVMDWGLAKVLSDSPGPPREEETDELPATIQLKTAIDTPARDGSATRTGSILGTPAYMSPEQAGGEIRKLDARSDVFGLGAILCQILTGAPPYRGKDANQVRLMAVRGELADALERLDASGAEPDLVALCKRCLAAKQEDRPADAGVVAADVAALRATADERARQAELERARAEVQAAEQRRRKHAVQIAAAVVAVVLLAGIVGTTLGLMRAGHALQEKTAALAAETKALEAESKARELVQTHLYAAELMNFAKAWDAGRFDQVYDTLKATHPERTTEDLRGWEWHHLHAIAYSEQLRFNRHSAPISTTALSSDDVSAASGDRDGNILIWDAWSGAIRQHIRPFADTVLRLKFSPSGKMLAAGSADSTAVILNVESGQTLHTIDEHVLGVHVVEFGPDDDLLATAAADGTVKVSRARGGAWETTTLQGHTGPVRSVRFDKSGQRLASVADDRTLRFWSLRDGQWQVEDTINGVPGVTALGSDLDRFAIWLEKLAAVAVLDAKTKKPLLRLPGYKARVLDMTFSHDGSLLATADEDGDAVVWQLAAMHVEDAENNQLGRARLVAQYRGASTSVLISSSNNSIASLCSDGVIRIWPAQMQARDHFRGHPGYVCAVGFSPDGKTVATGDMFGEVRIWDRRSGALMRTLGKHLRVEGPRGTVESAKTLAEVAEVNRKYLSVMQLAGEPERWVWVFEGHAGEVAGIEFSADGMTLATAGYDGKLWFWDVDTGKVLDVLAHPQLISSLARSADGKWLATGCWDDQVRIWDFQRREQHLALAGHEDNVDAVAFHPGGKYLASGGADRIVRIWDLQTGLVSRELPGHNDEINALAFSADGSLLASGSSDRTIRVWDSPSGQMRFELRGHTQRITRLLFHPTQSRLFSISDLEDDARVRVWDLAIGREVIALPVPDTDVSDIALDREGRDLAVASGRRIVLWQSTETGRSVSALVAAVDSAPARPPDRSAAKVLGLLRREKLTRAIGNTDDPILPAQADHELLVLIVSLPHSSLYPTRQQYEILQAKAEAGKRSPGPIKSHLVFDAESFDLVLPDGQTTTAIAIAPLPFAFEINGGFKAGNMKQSSSSAFKPNERAMMAVACEVPRGMNGKFELQFNGEGRVSVPPVQFDDYRWQPRESSLGPDGDLGGLDQDAAASGVQRVESFSSGFKPAK